VLCALQISEARSAAREAELKLNAAESRANKVSECQCACSGVTTECYVLAMHEARAVAAMCVQVTPAG
jgi:hypothetical protein